MTVILITLGDPTGIGPEVILKALAHPALRDLRSATGQPVQWRIVGSGDILQQTYDRLCHLDRHDDRPSFVNPADLDLVDLDEWHPPGTPPLEPGQPSAHSGDLSFQYLRWAVDAVLRGEAQGMVTAPIAKAAWMAAGHHYPGQTEFLAERSRHDRFGMLFVAESPHTGWLLRALLATTHIPLSQVPQAVTPDLLDQKLDLLIETLASRFQVQAPRIAIAGLNPHSGEQGKLGREEVDWMLPWLTAARNRYPHATLEGLIPPDTMWIKPAQAWWHSPDRGHDAYLALYHDQGLIPVKLLAFDRAVNTTIGLPFIRTSPDHGTAFDIAGQGIAQAESMVSALRLAAALTP